MKKDMTPTIGFIAGLILIIWSITLDGSIANFVDVPSAIITILGSFCALLISFPLKTLLGIPSILKLLMISPKDDRQKLVILFSELSKKARKDGLLAIEDDINLLDDEFLISGLQMVVDGAEPETIRDILELKLDTTERRHQTGQEVFDKWGELAPAFGMLGTLIGLVIMLSKLEDPSSIGAGMATALITTFYGSLMANLVFIPIASNLRVQTEEELFTGQMMIEGILEIQSGSNPRILEEKLLTYLSTEEKNSLKNNKIDGKVVNNYE